MKIFNFFLSGRLFVCSFILFSQFIPVINGQITGKPNIVFILIDDLGYGDIGCYGNRKNQTPHIDELARKGMRFTDYHANGPMCSPTRASFLTGKYQYRFGRKFESALDGSMNGPDNGLPLSAYTIAEALKNSGYTTALYGKWHLGYKPPLLPGNQGFDDYIGSAYGDGDHFTHVDRLGNADWWHNDSLRPENGYSVDLITKHSVNFIRRNSYRPFFLFVSHLAIHFPWQGPEDPPQRIAGQDYQQDKWGIIPNRKNVGKHIKSMVESVDESVGEIISALKEAGVEKNTLVIFSSDNGGYTEYKAGGFENISSNGPFRGQKGDVYEGGHRVPFIAYWPGKIGEGIVNNNLIMTMDLFPSFLMLADKKVPDSLKLDGVSILPTLFENKKLDQRIVCWKIRKDKAIRKGNWKLDITENALTQLFNLDSDPGENKNLASQYPELVKRLMVEYSIWEKDVTSNYGIIK